MGPDAHAAVLLRLMGGLFGDVQGPVSSGERLYFPPMMSGPGNFTQLGLWLLRDH